jgi:hypothetical protein
MRFKATISGINGVKAQFTSMAKEAKEIVEVNLESMAQEWVNGAKRDAPKDESRLAGSISYSENNIAGQKSFVIVAQVFYAPFMEFGTKGKYLPIPGTEAIAEQFKGYKGGSFQQLLIAITRWVKRKGISGTYSVKTRRRKGSKINQYAEDYAAAWPIALSILRNGIRPHPYFFKQQDVVWPEMVRRIKQGLEAKTKVSVIMPSEVLRPRIVTI